MKTSILRTILLLTVYLSISACGNKGELYMPKKETKTTDAEQVSE